MLQGVSLSSLVSLSRLCLQKHVTWFRKCVAVTSGNASCTVRKLRQLQKKLGGGASEENFHFSDASRGPCEDSVRLYTVTTPRDRSMACRGKQAHRLHLVQEIAPQEVLFNSAEVVAANTSNAFLKLGLLLSLNPPFYEV